MSRLRVLMKRVVVLICMAAAMFAPPASAQGPLGRLDHVSLSGRDYVRLRDWAAANDFQVRWAVRDKEVELSDKRGRHVRLAVNSAEAEVSGVKLWLSHPLVAAAGGAVCLSRLDLQSTLQPLLFPAKNYTGQKVKLVMLDSGHGGKDPGNRVGSQTEKKFTLLLAFEVREQLKKSGVKVALTRSTDTFVELADRPAKAQRLGADLFVSLHFNAIEQGRSDVKGAEVYCLTPFGVSSTNTRGEGADSPWAIGNRSNDKNILLAWQLQHALLHNLGVEDRGVRRARFAVLRDALMPAALIEGGFMSHPEEGRKIFDPAYRHQMALAIANGILAYKRQVEGVDSSTNSIIPKTNATHL